MRRIFITLVLMVFIFPVSVFAGEYVLIKGKGMEVCEEYKKNLESFNEPEPMMCERKINPEFTEFKKPEWRDMDILKNMGLVKKLYRVLEGNYVDTHPDAWEDLIRTDIKYGHRIIKITSIDINNDGQNEKVIKYYVGVCPSTHFYGSSIVVLNEEGNEIDSGKIPSGIQGEPIGVGYWMYDVFLYKGQVHFDKWSQEIKKNRFSLAVFMIVNNKTQEICKYRYKPVSNKSIK